MAKLVALIGVEVLVLVAIGVTYLAYAVYKWRKKKHQATVQSTKPT